MHLLSLNDSLNIPQTLVEADERLRILGEVYVAQTKINNRLAADIAKLRVREAELNADAAEELAPLLRQESELQHELFGFAAPRKEALIAEGKTVHLPSGDIGWSMAKHPTVELLEDEPVIIARLKKMRGGRQFIRTKEEVNKNALREVRKPVAGLRYVQPDNFFATPKQALKPVKNVVVTTEGEKKEKAA